MKRKSKTGLQMLNDIGKKHRASKYPLTQRGERQPYSTQALGDSGVGSGYGQMNSGGDSNFPIPFGRMKMNAKKHAKKLPHLKPKGKRGKAQVGRLNRNFKTGGFNKIASAAGKKYGSAEAGKRVAGAIFNKMAEARGNARKPKKAKKYAHKGHTHMSRKAMKAC